MGAGASISAAELEKPLDGSDINSPELAKAEVVRLRALLATNATTSSTTGFDLKGESYDKLFSQVATGVWSVCTAHNPGNLAAMPKHNNRCFIFTIKDAEGGDFLFVYGIPDSAFITNVKAVEEESKLKIKYIMSSGCWHHLYLEDWINAFEEPVKFLMTSAKFPETRNGQKLLSIPEMKARLELYDLEVPFLTKYNSQVQFHVMDQQTTFPDTGAFAATKELVPAEKMNEVMAEFAKPKTARFASVNVYHVATKTIVIDHNFAMFQPGEVWDEQSDMEQSFHPRNKLQSNVATGNRVIDPQKNFEQIQALLQFDCCCLVDLHTPPTYNVMTFENQAAFVAEITRVFEESGEMDPTSTKLMLHQTKEEAAAPAEESA